MAISQLEPLVSIDVAGISLREVAERRLMPLSKASLYRWAESGDSPFVKIRGKWMTTPELLKEAIVNGPKPKAPSIGNPMPRHGRHRSSFAAKVAEREGSN